MHVRKLWIVPVAALALSGCAENEGPLGPDSGIGAPDEVRASLSCQADVRGGTVSCKLPESAPGSASGVLIGGQGEYVLLESSGVSYDPADSLGPMFSADVALRNYLTQTLGTVDGVNADPNGIRIFFVDNPQVTSGTGTVSVRNADGTADFTRAGQPYFQYDVMLAPGTGSGTKKWQWDVPETVEAFNFVVGVSASVADEDAIEPGVQLDASTLSVGHEFNCALDAAGKAYCWGANGNGQLADGTTENRSIPTPVDTDLTFSAISAGVNHACAISTEGDAYCWGLRATNRLGIGGSNDSSAVVTPTLVQGGHKFITISAGDNHTCAISVDNDAYCWGYGGNAKTGRGNTNTSASPFKVIGDLKYKSISAGFYHTCAITIDDTAVCWGSSGSGRSGVGEGVSGNVTTPTPVASAEKFASVIAGYTSSCALTTGGDAYCFGSNAYRQLGNGTTDNSAVPTPVSGGHKFVSISLWYYHACGTTATGEVYCWGNNDWGRLGIGNTVAQAEPVQVQAPVKFAYAGTGRYHTCGVSTEGAVYCWGRNDSANQLGTGRSGARYNPAPVSIIAPSDD